MPWLVYTALVLDLYVETREAGPGGMLETYTLSRSLS